MQNVVSVEEALHLAQTRAEDFGWVDVRSEGEFSIGSLPLSNNTPILNNQQRHQVGIAFKNQGQDSAVLLGHELVAPSKDRLCEKWHSHLALKDHRFVFCWRGGLRSRISQDWLAESGLEVSRVEGGYKAIRGHLLKSLDRLPALVVLSGKTGARKTAILETLPRDNTIDLEGLANHRGSAFGGFFDREQPPQSTFENHLLWRLSACKDGTVLEDESRIIGKCALPAALYESMAASPRVVVQTSIEERTSNIFDEYVVDEIVSKKTPTEKVKERYQKCLRGIQKKLGWSFYQELARAMDSAFDSEVPDPEKHSLWILPLLERYYDKLYENLLSKKNCPIAFSGPVEECRQWLRDFTKQQAP